MIKMLLFGVGRVSVVVFVLLFLFLLVRRFWHSPILSRGFFRFLVEYVANGDVPEDQHRE